MKVVEIFNSIEGEGKRAGLPCTFIRLYGCNLNCAYCDSRYACEDDNNAFVMSIDEILEQVKFYGCKTITITGGEPLLQPGVYDLIKKLLVWGCWVNVETNGTIDPEYRPMYDPIFYTMDYKTGASGMSTMMNDDAFRSLTRNDVLKFVVGSIDDLNQALEIVEKFNPSAEIYVSPVFGQIEPSEIVNFIRTHKLWKWQVQLQLHKYIFDPDARGV